MADRTVIWRRRCALATSVRPRGGFSYLEMLVVLLMLGTLAAIAVPDLAEGVRRHRLREAAERVRSAILEGTELARTSGLDQEIIAPAGAARIYLPGATDPATRAAPWTIELGGGESGCRIESSRFGAAALEHLSIDEGGRLRDEGTIRLTLGGRSIDVTVTGQDVVIGAIR